MRLFGYESNNYDEPTDYDPPLLNLAEVCVQATPEEIRTCADFLRDMASKMEQFGHAFGHAHLKYYCRDKGIPQLVGTTDLIVAGDKPDGRPVCTF